MLMELGVRLMPIGRGKRGGKGFPGDVQTNAGQGGGVAEHVGIGCLHLRDFW